MHDKTSIQKQAGSLWYGEPGRTPATKSATKFWEEPKKQISREAATAIRP